MIDSSKILLRWLFAIASWFMAIGTLVLMFRADNSGQAGALFFMTAALAVNGLLVLPSRQT